MKTSNFLSRIWNFLRKLFNPSSEDFKEVVTINKIEDEEVLAENMIKNNQLYPEKLYPWAQTNNNNDLPKAIVEISKEEPIFEKKEPVAEVVKVKKVRRILTYKNETKEGLILYEGRKVSKFIKESGLDLGFTQDQVYEFANKHQATKIFKKKYFVSFTEIPHKK